MLFAFFLILHAKRAEISLKSGATARGVHGLPPASDTDRRFTRSDLAVGRTFLCGVRHACCRSTELAEVRFGLSEIVVIQKSRAAAERAALHIKSLPLSPALVR